MTFIIYKNGSIIYSNFISELFNAGSVELGTITNNQTENYEFEANFAKELGNEYQNKKIVFDLLFTVTSESGTSQVLSSSAASSNTNSTNTPGSVIGQILGLSDTSGEFIFGLLIKTAGIIILLAGLNTLLRNRSRKLSTA